MKCDFNCDDCTRTLCTQGNPTLEPTPEELEELEADLNRQFFGSPSRSGTDAPHTMPRRGE